jgi:hypothetical protein
MKHPVGVEMKNIRLVIGIVIILALVCSPALAISKADLISQYMGQSSPTILTPNKESTPAGWTPDIHVVYPTFSFPSLDDLANLLARYDEYWANPTQPYWVVVSR